MSKRFSICVLSVSLLVLVFTLTGEIRLKERTNSYRQTCCFTLQEERGMWSCRAD